MSVDTAVWKRQAGAEWARLARAFHWSRVRRARPPQWRSIPPWAKWTAGVILAIVVAVLLFLTWFNWNMLRGPIARYASERTGRPVAINGDLKVKLLTWTPTASVDGVTVGNPAWAPREDMARIDNLTVSVGLVPLFSGHVVLPLVRLQAPDVSLFRDNTGRANWDFAPTGQSSGAKKPFKLPPIQTFVIRDGRLRMADQKRGLTFAGSVNAREQAEGGGREGFRLEGKGELNRKIFVASLTGGPLINVRPNTAYPFDADVRAGGTHVVAKGAIPKPFDLGVLDSTVTVSGDDLNDLYYLTGLALPNTPAYRVSGRLRRDNLTYRVDDLKGRIGGSDVEGALTVETASGRPFVKGALTSRLLDFKDLGTLFGAPLASRASSPGQKAVAEQRAETGRLLPDATLRVERVRAMDADIHYQAASVKAQGIPLRRVELGVKLDHGLLSLDPVALHFPSGRLYGTARVDARGATPVSDLDLRVNGVKLENFLQKTGGPAPVEGVLDARAKLHGSGDSVHKAASTADGTMTLVIPRGQVRQVFAELLGIDATKSLFLLLAKDQSPTDIRCAVAEFKVQGGVMQAQNVVFDTGVVTAMGSGTIDLGRESLNLAFTGKPKSFRLIRIKAPITVTGPLRSPKFGVNAGSAAVQAGAGLALGAFLSPIALILPFVDPGLAKDANCIGLIQQAQVRGTPVKTAATTPARPPKG